MELKNGIKVHPYAEYFPVIEGEEYEMLKEDINKNGQLEPCVLYEGELLDGVNRMRACLDLGIEPLTEVYCGENPLDYVVSLNIRRRHLDVSQRAMLATEMLPVFEEEAKRRQAEALEKGRATQRAPVGAQHEPYNDIRKWNEKHKSADDSAKIFGVSRKTVERAKRIKEQAPEKVQDIITGKATVSAVDNELRMERAKKTAEEHREKQIDKVVKEVPRGVADYFDFLKSFKEKLEITVEGQKRQSWFSPESVNIIKKKHGEIKEMMNKLEELI